MKNRIFSSFAALILVFSLCFFLTGCSKQTYRKAVSLYNEGKYDAAATLFSQISDYEDSRELQTLSRYWEALTLMENGEYSKALPRFLKLGSYEDSAARAVECKYQLAIIAFSSGDFKTAENHFLEQPQYRQTQEYLRRINWQKLFDAVKKSGSETGTGITLERELDGKALQITAAEPDVLTLSVSAAKDNGFRFFDLLTLTLHRDSPEADFTAASSFDMDFPGGQIGSVQNTSGIIDISSADSGLIIRDFEMIVTDNQGHTSTVNDPAKCLMEDTMAENLSLLLSEIPLLLTDSGIQLTLEDIGFASNP